MNNPQIASLVMINSGVISKLSNFGPQAISIIEAIHIDGFLRAGDDINRNVVVASFLSTNQTVHGFLLRTRIKGKVAYAMGTIESIASGSPQRTR